ncbi:hypothetical protein, partial [Escherichia coli]|uniref:hypothetical protein n=1 Tax=Escherichia coli TaxID=562 RepID=UPI001953E377
MAGTIADDPVFGLLTSTMLEVLYHSAACRSKHPADTAGSPFWNRNAVRVISFARAAACSR